MSLATTSDHNRDR